MFAEGYTGLAATNGRATFTEVLNILNPGIADAPITVTYYVEGRQAPIVVTRVVAHASVLRESVNADVGPDKVPAAIVTSPSHVVVTRSISRVSPAGARLDGSTTQGVNAGATTWYFAEGYTGVSFQEYATLLNPTASQATATILLAPQAADSRGARAWTRILPPFSRTTINVRALNQGNSAQSVGMEISSDLPIVAERVEYFGDGAGSGKFGSVVSQGIAAAPQQAWFPFGSSGGSALDARGTKQPVGDQDYITLLNPSGRSGSVQVTASFDDASGRALAQPVTVKVASGTRMTIIANLALGAQATGPFSVSLHGTGPFIAESAQYFGGSPNVGAHPGVAYAAQTAATSDALLSDLSINLVDGTGLRRAVYLYNPTASQVQVSVRYFGVSGPGGLALYTVSPGAIIKIGVNQDALGLLAIGPLGGELKVVPGTNGVFMAISLGTTVDGLSATEDSGAPAG
jgi:hypothetical protein